jgi:predicted lipopolysaccharide heptosyltransferase III
VNILLLQLRRIGDLILTTPAIDALRERFPDSRITLAISNECRELGPAISNVDRIFIIRRTLRDIGVFFAAAGGKFDCCIDFTQNDRSALLTFLSGARKRIASYQVEKKSERRSRVYNELVQQRMRELHTLDYHLALLDPLGIQGFAPKLHLAIPSEADEKAGRLRRDARIGNPFVVFHPGAARVEKFWQAERWARVIDRLRSHWHFDVVLTGSSSEFEQEQIRRIKASLRRPAVDLSGKTDLLTLAALIARAQLLVTVDSAPMHLAAATHTPQVVLFGLTNPFHWRPRESPASILQGESGAPVTEFSFKQKGASMNQISTESVIDAISGLLPAPATQTV